MDERCADQCLPLEPRYGLLHALGALIPDVARESESQAEELRAILTLEVGSAGITEDLLTRWAKSHPPPMTRDDRGARRARRAHPNRSKEPTVAEPYKLRKWRLELDGRAVIFWTCARPGRSPGEGGPDGGVSDEVVRTWFSNLGEPPVALISLLGWKHGVSEYDFYSFRGTHDGHRSTVPTWAAWIAREYAGQRVVLREHPTDDFEPVTDVVRNEVKSALIELAARGMAVFLVDSGGEQRGVNLAKSIGAKEHFGS